MIPKWTFTGAVFLLISVFSIPVLGVEHHAGMFRYPDVSTTQIVFAYAGDLWVVPIQGGSASPLTSARGPERFPCFSPDGESIAFQANYDGSSDIYTITASGGPPFRVTHHPESETPWDWTRDGRLVFSSRGIGSHPHTEELCSVPAAGGLPEKMVVPYGAMGTISSDGEWLAYTPHTADNRTLKRYRGGMATDIWLYQLKRHESLKITDWEGTDTQPMWHGHLLYYLSDAGTEHRLNIWAYDKRTEAHRQVTHFEKYDVKWPAVGTANIVFQLGSELYLLDLATEETWNVEITIPGDRPQIRTQAKDVAGQIQNRNISATGKRVVVEARGDIWTLPAHDGSPVNLTRTGGVAERDPAWSSDDRWIAYFSDETGGYELCVRQADGRGKVRTLTNLRSAFLEDPVWSPDSKRIAFWDISGTLRICDVESAALKEVYSSPGGSRPRVSWAGDSNWLTFADAESLCRSSAIWLYSMKDDSLKRVTAGMFYDSWPVFDREGRYLYFASQRDFTCPINDHLGTTWIHANTDRLYLVPLQAGGRSPFLPDSDEENSGEEKGEQKGRGDNGGAEVLKIDVDGFEQRAVVLPVEHGSFSHLAVNHEGNLLYARYPVEGTGGTRSISLFDLDAERETTVLKGVSMFVLSDEGKKLLATQSDGGMAVLNSTPNQSMGNMVSTAGMTAWIDPREEWRQIFIEAWKLQRDYFYDPNMHGLDWEAVRSQYAAMLEDCTSQDDVAYVIREMIAELNVSHAFYWGGDVETGPAVSVGMLGCDYELHQGAFRIARIYEGAPWDVQDRGPLSQPGVGVEVGDYLLAVNSVPLDPSRDPWAAFQGLAGKAVTLTVGDRADINDARDVVVEPIQDERHLRFRAWIENKRAYVEKRTDGRVGYIYVPDTGGRGQNELVRQFWGQRDKEALIIDERWNTGGNNPDRLVELLNRPVSFYWAHRYGEDQVWPTDAHHGPKCMLINGLAGSGGDLFPYLFRERRLGKLIGTRTKGGVVAVRRRFTLIDGSRIIAPARGVYEKDGTWGIEGHGVEPDIEVIDDPALMVDGGDPQLDAAIDHMIEEIRRNPYRPPARPKFPDRSGLGLAPEDR